MKTNTMKKNLKKDPVKNRKSRKIRKFLEEINFLMIKPNRTIYMKTLIQLIKKNKGMIPKSWREGIKE